MQKMKALVRHILDISKIPEENIWAFADAGTLTPTGRDLGPLRADDGTIIGHQIELGLLKYDAVIDIERYPGKAFHLISLITAWLADNDPERFGLSDPEIDVDLNLKNGDSDVQIAIEFEEIIQAIEDKEGNIPFNGKKWTIKDAEIIPAEQLKNLKGA